MNSPAEMTIDEAPCPGDAPPRLRVVTAVASTSMLLRRALGALVASSVLVAGCATTPVSPSTVIDPASPPVPSVVPATATTTATATASTPDSDRLHDPDFGAADAGARTHPDSAARRRSPASPPTPPRSSRARVDRTSLDLQATYDVSARLDFATRAFQRPHHARHHEYQRRPDRSVWSSTPSPPALARCTS